MSITICKHCKKTIINGGLHINGKHYCSDECFNNSGDMKNNQAKNEQKSKELNEKNKKEIEAEREEIRQKFESIKDKSDEESKKLEEKLEKLDEKIEVLNKLEIERKTQKDLNRPKNLSGVVSSSGVIGKDISEEDFNKESNIYSERHKQ